ncbi:GroES-like protein [Mycena venus]|uniref:GroES-like protein n=1 Tax=Mycena venus TaxID=2733690 RepID=A0A8H6XXQ3_9AGAR|nr:GroES-like protein [Mycena venus]
MSTQQALIIPSPKAPFVVSPLPIPIPNKGDVRLKIISVGLNPMNWAQHEWDFLIPEYPGVIGADLAGVVDEVGEGVEGFAKGDEVLAQVINGGFQQYTTLPAATLIRKPKNISFDEAATFPITFTTACVGLFAPAPIGLALNPTISWDKLHQGESGLVIGAGTSTGQFAVQLFKFLGFTRIVVYASKVHFDYLKSLGATECIDRGDVPLDKLVVSPPVKVVYDATAPGALDAAYDSVVEGGLITTVRPQAQTNREPRGVTLVKCFGFYAGPDVMPAIGDPASYPSKVEHTLFGKFIIEELPRMMEKGAIVANRVEIVPNGLAGIPDALERMKAGGVSGVKLVAHPQESAT